MSHGTTVCWCNFQLSIQFTHMAQTKAVDLIKDLKRHENNIPPFEGRAMHEVTEEMKALYDDIATMVEYVDALYN